jgi:O-acetylhomoserine (thiol)-lyase
MPGYSDPGFDTLSLHAGARSPDPATGARAVPIHLTTSFVFESSDHAASPVQPGTTPATSTRRISNPTNAVLEQRVSALEGGVGAIASVQRPGGAAPVDCDPHGRRQRISSPARRCMAAAQNLLYYTLAPFRHRDHLREAR